MKRFMLPVIMVVIYHSRGAPVCLRRSSARSLAVRLVRPVARSSAPSLATPAWARLSVELLA
jgi:hypothetical protein